MCRFLLPKAVRRLIAAIVHYLRPSTGLRYPRVRDAQAETEEAERIAAARALARAEAERESKECEERIRRHIRAIEAEVRSRGAS